MKVYTIPQKISGTGTIHDIASQHYDREIKFRKGYKFAVVLAAYYGTNIYTTHRTAEAAAAESVKQDDFSHTIIDDTGKAYHRVNIGPGKYDVTLAR